MVASEAAPISLGSTDPKFLNLQPISALLDERRYGLLSESQIPDLSVKQRHLVAALERYWVHASPHCSASDHAGDCHALVKLRRSTKGGWDLGGWSKGGSYASWQGIITSTSAPSNARTDLLGRGPNGAVDNPLLLSDTGFDVTGDDFAELYDPPPSGRVCRPRPRIFNIQLSCAAT